MASITGGHCLCPPERQGKAVVARFGILRCNLVCYGGLGADRRGTFCCGVTQVRRVRLRRFRLGWVWFHAVRFGMAVWVRLASTVVMWSVLVRCAGSGYSGQGWVRSVEIS